MKKSDSHELLIEIGVEEMPSDLIETAIFDLKENAEKQITSAFIPHLKLEGYATPRRLILYTSQLAKQQEDRTETIMGPPKKVAFDAKGNPTAAATGFAKTNQISLSDISIIKTEKGEYLSVQKKIIGQPTSAFLSKMIPEIISSLHFPKSMHWGDGFRFIRPIRWLTVLYGGKIVPCAYASLKASNHSYGHRLIAPESFKVTDFSSYQKEMKKRFVIIDPTARYNLIKKQIMALIAEVKGNIIEDESLLWQAAYSTEYPIAICGEFDPIYLSIPKEIINTAMKEHQGYFPITATNSNKQLPNFIAILNNKDPKKIIQKGSERVLRARLSDAAFYFEKDKKEPLLNRLAGLKGVMFIDKLGTIHDKTNRLIALSQYIAQRTTTPIPDTEIERLARLSKCDLTTGVVREFPSLQGTMGRILVELNNEEGQAIEEHYQPRYPGDRLPASTAGQILSIADKLDTIVGCFGIGAIPTGSEDPHALRRQGLGLIQILSAESHFPQLHLREIIHEAIRCYQQESKITFPDNNKTALEVERFLKQRIQAHLQSEKIRYDIIDTVLANTTAMAPYQIQKLAKSLSDFSKKSLFNPLIICYKRANRILPDQIDWSFNHALLEKGGEAEKSLYGAISNADKEIKQYESQQRFDLVLESLATLFVPLDRFFQEVLVMDPNDDIRKNHLYQLKIVKNIFDKLGNFSKIQEGEINAK